MQTEENMRALDFAEAEANLATVLDRVIDDAELAIITRRGDADGSRSVVILSLDSYNSTVETMHLMGGGNGKRLMESIAQLRAGQDR